MKSEEYDQLREAIIEAAVNQYCDQERAERIADDAMESASVDQEPERKPYLVRMIIRDGEHEVEHVSVRYAKDSDHASTLAVEGQSYGPQDYRAFSVTDCSLMSGDEVPVLKRLGFYVHNDE